MNRDWLYLGSVNLGQLRVTVGEPWLAKILNENFSTPSVMILRRWGGGTTTYLFVAISERTEASSNISRDDTSLHYRDHNQHQEGE